MNSNKELKIIEKIPLFQDLSLNQVHQLLNSGHKVNYQKGKILCKEGDKSTDMLILLAGELVIRRKNKELTSVTPVEIVGEMGLITGLPRSAQVEVTKDATLILINKMKFDVLLKRDATVATKIYRNMLIMLCGRLQEANDRFDQSSKDEDKKIVRSMI